MFESRHRNNPWGIPTELLYGKTVTETKKIIVWWREEMKKDPELFEAFLKPREYEKIDLIRFSIKRTTVPSANDFITIDGVTEDPDEIFNLAERARVELRDSKISLVNYDIMTGKEFEDYIMNMVNASAVTQSKGGFDGILPDGRALEIKSGETVGVGHITKFAGDMAVAGIDGGVLIYRNKITGPARMKCHAIQGVEIEVRHTSEIIV